MQKRLDNVSLSFQDNGLTVGSYIHHFTHSSEHTATCQAAQKSLQIDHAVSICGDLANYLPTRPSVILWTIKTAKQLFRKHVSELTQEQHGLHFHASKTSSSYLEGSFMEESEDKQRQMLRHYIFCQALGCGQHKIRFKMWLSLSVAMLALWLNSRNKIFL